MPKQNSTTQTTEIKEQVWKVLFYMNKETITDFDKICKLKNSKRSEGLIKLVTKFVEKNRHLLSEDDKGGAATQKHSK